MATETQVLKLDNSSFMSGIKEAIRSFKLYEDAADDAEKASKDVDKSMGSIGKGSAALAGAVAGLTAGLVGLVGKGLEAAGERMVELGQENDQIGGKINDLKAVIDEFLKLLLPVMEDLLDIVLNVSDGILAFARSFSEGGERAGMFGEVMGWLSTTFDAVAAELDPLIDLILQFGEFIAKLQLIVAGVTIELLNMLLKALKPVGEFIWKYLKPVIEAIGGAFGAMNDQLDVVITGNEGLSTVYDGLVGAATGAAAATRGLTNDRKAQSKTDKQIESDRKATEEALKKREEEEKKRHEAEKKRYEEGQKLAQEQRDRLKALMQSYQDLIDKALTPLQQAQKENLEEQNKVREALQFGAGDADELRKMLDELKKAYDKLGETTPDEMFKNVAFWIDQATTAITGLLGGATSLLGVFGQIGSGDIIGGLASIVDSIGRAFEGLGNRITAVTEKLAKKLGETATFVGKTVGVAFGALGAVIGALGGVIVGVQSLVEGLTGFSLTDLLNADPGALAEIFGRAGDNLLQKLEQFPDRLIALLGDGRLLALVEKTVKGVVEAFDKVLPDVVDFLVNVLAIVFQSLPALVDTLIESLPTLVNNLIETLAASLPELLPKLVELAVGLVVAIVDAIPEIIVALIKALPKLLLELGKGIFKIAFELLQVVPEILGQIVEAMKDAILGFIEQILRSLGLDKAADRVADKAAGTTPTNSFNDTPGVQNVGPRGAMYSFAPGDMVIAAKTLEGLQKQVNVNVNQDQVVMEQRMTRIAIENLAYELKYARSQTVFKPQSVAGY